MANTFNHTIASFGGLNLPQEGSVPKNDNDSPKMKNFCITRSGQLKLREGYRTLQKLEGSVRCLWQGTLLGRTLHLVVAKNTLYASEDAFSTLQEIGHVPGEGDLCCLEFREVLYFLTGQGILAFDGERLEEIKPYRPLIRITSPPTGGGIPFEDVNYLTGEVRQTFSADGESLFFYLAEPTVKSIDYIIRDGVELCSGVDFFPDEMHGRVQILGEGQTEIPKAGTDNIEIGYTLWEEPVNNPAFCLQGITYGGENDTRAFLYGNPYEPAMRYYSGIVDAMPSMRYFPVSNASMVGDGEPITSIVRHYDRQIIFTPHAAYYSYPEVQTEETGRQYTSFPVYTLSALRGNIVFGASLLVDNKPLSVMPSGLYLWNSTSVRDERNAVCISECINEGLIRENLKETRLFLRASKSEVYAVLPQGGIYVYHQAKNRFYYYEGFSPTAMLEDEKNRFFFGDSEGKLCIIEGSTDDGAGIDAFWESAALSCSSPTRTKNLFSVTVGLSPEAEAPFELSWHTDNAASHAKNGKANVLSSRLFSLDALDFAAFSLDTARHMHERRVRIGAKRFCHITLKLRHPAECTEDLCVTHLILRGKENDQHT